MEAGEQSRFTGATQQAHDTANILPGPLTGDGVPCPQDTGSEVKGRSRPGANCRDHAAPMPAVTFLFTTSAKRACRL